MEKIDVNDFANKIKNILEEWRGVTEEAVAMGIAETAEHAVNQLHAANPAGSGQYASWSDYNASWRSSSTPWAKGKQSVVVHNEKKYRLTHLLENGHALKNGGRARPFPHIAPVAEEAERDLLENIRKYITT